MWTVTATPSASPYARPVRASVFSTPRAAGVRWLASHDSLRPSRLDASPRPRARTPSDCSTTPPSSVQSSMEEAQEAIEASSTEDAVWETADLVYFSLVAMTTRGGRLQDVIETLNRRALGVSRRRGDAKPVEESRG